LPNNYQQRKGNIKMIIAAEYTRATKRISPMLWITKIEGGRRTYVGGFSVSGKVEARKVAKEQGAEPWNF
jgi:hypothetical protein